MARKNTRSNDNPDTSLAAPQTRKERFLAKAAGLVAQAPIGQYNRLERYLQAIIERLDAGFYPTDAQLAAINSGATEAKINAIETKLPQYGMGKNLLRNAYFVGGGSQKGYGTFPINQRDGYVVPPDVERWNPDTQTHEGVTSTYCTVETKPDSYGNVGIHDGGVYYTVPFSSCVPGYDLLYYRDKPIFDCFKGYGEVAGTVALIKDDCIKIISQGNWSQIYYPSNTELNNIVARNIVTLSILFKSVDEGTRVRISNGAEEYVTPGSNILYTKTYTTNDFSKPAVSIMNWTPGAQFEVIAMGLELGDTQTLAHQENGVWVPNEVPYYGEELRRCQEWQYVSSVNASNRYEQTYMYAFSNKILIGSIPFKQTMRVRPTMEKLWCYDVNGNAIDITGSDVVSTQDAVLLIRDIPNSPLTPGNYYTVGVFAIANP